MKVNIYPSITSTNFTKKNNWRERVDEVNRYHLKKVCLFPTCLNSKERDELYKLLEKTSIKEVPFVHIRHDFKKEEIDFLINNFGTRLFNIHSQKEMEFKLKNDLSRYKKKYIYLETTHTSLADELNDYAGICLDVSHIEDNRIKKNNLYKQFMTDLKKFPIGITHLSAIHKTTIKIDGKLTYSHHFFNNLSEFDYLKRYRNYLSKVAALELESSIEDQLKVIDYLKKSLLII